MSMLMQNRRHNPRAKSARQARRITRHRDAQALRLQIARGEW